MAFHKIVAKYCMEIEETGEGRRHPYYPIGSAIGGHHPIFIQVLKIFGKDDWAPLVSMDIFAFTNLWSFKLNGYYTINCKPCGEGEPLKRGNSEGELFVAI